ncbi:MAG: hypothetical protein QGG48_10525, partial [Desulfatiglandales bacterium]|nr:hypothetical protein [Desulfatiglandales bacterium]
MLDHKIELARNIWGNAQGQRHCDFYREMQITSLPSTHTPRHNTTANKAMKVCFIPATIPPTPDGASTGGTLKNPKKSHTPINMK